MTPTPPTAEPKSNRRAIIAIVLAVVGIAAMAWSFPNGIVAALDGSSGGAGLYIVVFLLGSALVAVALVLSILGFMRRQSVALSTVAFVLALLPALAVLWLRLVNGT